MAVSRPASRNLLATYSAVALSSGEPAICGACVRIRRCSSASLGSGTAMNFFSISCSRATSRKPVMTQFCGWTFDAPAFDTSSDGGPDALSNACRFAQISRKNSATPERTFMTLLVSFLSLSTCSVDMKQRLYRGTKMAIVRVTLGGDEQVPNGPFFRSSGELRSLSPGVSTGGSRPSSRSVRTPAHPCCRRHRFRDGLVYAVASGERKLRVCGGTQRRDARNGCKCARGL